MTTSQIQVKNINQGNLSQSLFVRESWFKIVIVTLFVICSAWVVGHTAKKSDGSHDFNVVEAHPHSMVLCRSTGNLAVSAGASIEGIGTSATLSTDIEECAANPNPIAGGHRKWHEVTEDVNDTIWDTVACVMKEQITVAQDFDVIVKKKDIYIPIKIPFTDIIIRVRLWRHIWTTGELRNVDCKDKDYTIN